MTNKKEKKKSGKTESGPVGRPVRTRKKILPSTKAIAYQALRNSGVSVKDAKTLVNIGDNTNFSKGTLSQQRETALKALDLTLYSQYKTLKEIRDDKQISCPSDRIHAVKTLNTMIPGFLAPQEVNVNNTSVMIEFCDLSSQELMELSESLSGEIRGSIEDADFQVIDNERVT